MKKFFKKCVEWLKNFLHLGNTREVPVISTPKKKRAPKKTKTPKPACMNENIVTEISDTIKKPIKRAPRKKAPIDPTKPKPARKSRAKKLDN